MTFPFYRCPEFCFANTNLFFYLFVYYVPWYYFPRRRGKQRGTWTHVPPLIVIFTGTWVCEKRSRFWPWPWVFLRAISRHVWLTFPQVRERHRGQTLQVEVSGPAADDGETLLHALALVRASRTVLHEVHAVFTLQEIRPSLSCLNEVILTNHGD